MDDIVSGAVSVQDGLGRYKLLLKIFGEGGFALKKWATNSPELGMQMQASSGFADQVVKFADTDFKFLGVKWDQPADGLGVFTHKAVTESESRAPSKRQLLKCLAQVFDPLGIAAPILIAAKILLQALWAEKRDWDSPLTGRHLDNFNTVIEGLANAESIAVARALSSNSGGTTERSLHIFSDASLAAYGCVAYLRESHASGQVEVTFVAAKASVAPLKGIRTIHRLELLGAVMSVRLAQKIREAVAVAKDVVHFWVDNAAVLGWIRDSPEKWKPFVANRVREIRAASAPSEWR